MYTKHLTGAQDLPAYPRSTVEGHSTLRTYAFLLSLAFIFMIPWEGVELPGVGGVAKFVGFAAAACWYIAVLRVGQMRAPRLFHAIVFLFVIWNALSVIWSGDPGESADRAMTWVQLFVFVLMLWDLYTTRTAVLAGLQGYVVGAYAAVIGALVNYQGGPDSAFYTHYDRFSPGDTNPDGFGFILAMGIPLAWYLASARPVTTRADRVLRILNFAYIPVAFLGISLSGTRTALIATIPGMLYGLSSLLRLSRLGRVAALFLLAAGIAAVVWHVRDLRSFERFGTTVNELEEGDLNNRTKNWQQGLKSFARYPILGVGGNQYRTVNIWGKVAHNSYLSVLVETGLIGLALFGTILAIGLVQALGQPPWDRTFWLTQFAVWSIGAMTLTWEYRKSTWLFLGLVVASAAIARERGEGQAVPHAPR